MGDDHLLKGQRYKITQPDELDADLNEQYETHATRFESKVRAANEDKQKLREDIIALETEIRSMRDTLADKQT